MNLFYGSFSVRGREAKGSDVYDGGVAWKKTDGQILREQLSEGHLRSWNVHELFMKRYAQRPNSAAVDRNYSSTVHGVGLIGDCGAKRVLRSWGAWWKTNSKRTSEREKPPFMNCSWIVHELLIIQQRRGLPARPETKPTKRRMRGEQFEAQENKDIEKHEGRKDWATMPKWNRRGEMSTCPRDSCS